MRRLIALLCLAAASCAPLAAECADDAACPALSVCSEGVCVEGAAGLSAGPPAGTDDARDPRDATDALGVARDERAPVTDALGVVHEELAADAREDAAPDGTGVVAHLGDGCVSFVASFRLFVVCPGTSDHDEAVDDCAARNLTLASVHSALEIVALEEVFAVVDATDRVWIGLDESSGTARWLDGSPMDFTAYVGGAAIGQQGHEHCGVLEDGVWQDEDCSGKRFSRVCASAPLF